MQTTSIPHELRLETVNVREAALVFRALDHRLRLKILVLLHKNKRASVGYIYDKLEIEQSVASSHLAILRKANVVKTEREGRCVYYSVNYERLKIVSELAEGLLSN